MYDGLLVIDADSHKMENPVVFFDYLDAPYRDRLFSRTDRWGQQRLVVVDDAGLVAVEPASGHVRWQYDAPTRGWRVVQPHAVGRSHQDWN